jgi:hypothetical protein
MKKLSVLLALMALAFADAALAAGATVTSLTGAAQVQSGSAAPRTLRQGDQVVQGDTVSTGAGSALVLKFDDGQVAALTANSRMQVSAYAYNAQTRTGNVLLSLVVGGMRAITGLIGHNQPNNVNFRAATATIGIRGSDGDFVTDGVKVSITVRDGEFTFTFGDRTVSIPAGRGAFGADGKINEGTAQQIFDSLPPAFQQAIGGLEGLTAAINAAGPGIPQPGPANLPGNQDNTTPGNNQPGGGGGAGVNPNGGGPASNQ